MGEYADYEVDKIEQGFIDRAEKKSKAKDRPFACLKCNRKFGSPEALDQHTDAAHPGALEDVASKLAMAKLEAATVEHNKNPTQYATLRELPDRQIIERYFDNDGLVVVGWSGTNNAEALITIGANTSLNRDLGDFIAASLRCMR